MNSRNDKTKYITSSLKIFKLIVNIIINKLLFLTVTLEYHLVENNQQLPQKRKLHQKKVQKMATQVIQDLLCKNLRIKSKHLMKKKLRLR